MSKFKVRTVDTAPEQSVAFLQGAQRAFGFVTNLNRWFETVERRPAVVRAYEIGASINTTPTMTEESKKILLGQDHRAVAA